MAAVLDLGFLAASWQLLPPGAAITANGNSPALGVDISNATGRITVGLNIAAGFTGTILFSLESATTSGGTFAAPVIPAGSPAGSFNVTAAHSGTLQLFSVDSALLRRYVRLAWVATAASGIVASSAIGTIQYRN